MKKALILIALSFGLTSSAFAEKPLQPENKYNCAKKTCSKMDSCEEAEYKLKQCGHKQLDRDKDGIPCEKICGG